MNKKLGKLQFTNKWLCFFLISLIVVTFGACGNQKTEGTGSTISTQGAEPEQTSATTQPSSAPTSKGEKEHLSRDSSAEKDAEPVQADNNSKAAVLRAYAEAYNRTKAAGQLKGADSISILPGTFQLNNKANAIVEKLINGNVNHIFTRDGVLELPPSGPGYESCMVTEADIKIASRRENGEQIVLKLIPRDNGIPRRGEGGSGNLMEVVAVDQIKKLAGQQGVTFSGAQSFDDCVTLEYLGAECTIIIDRASGMITSAVYQSLIYAKAEHVNVAWFKDQAASATVRYEMHYPV